MNAYIDKDHLEDAIPKGKPWRFEGMRPEAEWSNVTRFRLYDDDGILYFSGSLEDDDQADTQYEVLKWAERDSGCTSIKVYVKGENGRYHWEEVIG